MVRMYLLMYTVALIAESLQSSLTSVENMPCVLKEVSNNSIREASGSAAVNLHFSRNVRTHSMPTVKGMAVAKHRVAIITRTQDN